MATPKRILPPCLRNGGEAARYPTGFWSALSVLVGCICLSSLTCPGGETEDVQGAVALLRGRIEKAVVEFEIRNAQNWNKGPVAKGIYEGRPVQLPMIGMDPVQPIGCEGYITREEMTGRDFNVFVLTSWTPGSRALPDRNDAL